MANKVTTLVTDWIDTTGAAVEMRAIVSQHSNGLDADAALRDFVSEQLDIDDANMATDLITNALAWVDWTGITNELIGQGRTTDNPTDTSDEARTEYNGWENKATWAVALWLDNEEYTYNESRSLVGGASQSWATKALKNFVRDLCSRYLEQSDINQRLRADLLTYELNMVRWDHVARSIMEE